MKNKSLILWVLAAVIVFGAAIFFQRFSAGADFLWSISDNGRVLLPMVVVSSLVDSVNPCAFGILILTIAFLFSLGKSRGSIAKIGGVYILGLFVVYLLIGLGILQVLHLFNTPHFMGKIGAALLIVLAVINLINEFFPKFPIKLKIPAAAHTKIAALMEKASMPTAFMLGVLVGLCEFPCTGGPYLMVLGLLRDRETYFTGTGYLLLYNLVFVLPLLVILAIASNQGLLAKVQQWKKAETGHMRVLGSLAMIALGLLMYYL